MARIRTIKPEFFTSEQLAECSPRARLLFVGLWVFSDDQGVHPASVKRLKMEVFPGDALTDSDMQEMVSELLSQQLLGEFESQGQSYWYVTGWHHQKIDKPTARYPRPPLPEHSPNGRGALGESSDREGKGREGKGRESTSASTSASGPLLVGEWSRQRIQTLTDRANRIAERIGAGLKADKPQDRWLIIGTSALVSERLLSQRDLDSVLEKCVGGRGAGYFWEAMRGVVADRGDDSDFDAMLKSVKVPPHPWPKEPS